MKKYLIVILLLQTSGFVENHRILGLFIHQLKSHFNVIQPIMYALAERGHNITLITHFPTSNPIANYNEILLPQKMLPEFRFKLADKVIDQSESVWSLYLSLVQLNEWAVTTCRDALNSTAFDQVIELHKTNPFDMIITELFISDCTLGVIHLIDVPFVDISSLGLVNWHNNRIGQDDYPSYLPTPSLGFTENMNFRQRMLNWINYKLGKYLFGIQQNNEKFYLEQKFQTIFPNLEDVAKKVSLILINSHFSSSISKPYPVNVIEIGGIHIKPRKPLPKDLRETLNNATRGAIVISWGSVIKGSTLNEFKRKSILKALQRISYQVIWKWENETMLDKPDNVLIYNWLPQQDTLCHPNVKVFWSHGGNLGTTEAVHCGVPLIITPIYGDQFHNGAILQARNVAKVLKYDLITEDTVFDTLSEILTPRYQKEMDKISFAFRNRPLPPLETAIRWIEYVQATGGNRLAKLHAVELSWFVYYSMDVVLVLVSVIVLIFGLCAVVLMKCCIRFRAKNLKLKKV